MSSISIEAIREDLVNVIEQTISARENVVLKSLLQFQDNVLQELLSLKLLLYKHCSSSTSKEIDLYNHATSKIRNVALGLLSRDTNIFPDSSKKKEPRKFLNSESEDEEKYLNWPSSQVFQKDVPTSPLVKTILHTKASDHIFSETSNNCSSSSQFLDSVSLNRDETCSPAIDLNEEEDVGQSSNFTAEFQGENSEDAGELLLDTSTGEKVKISPENIKQYYVELSDKNISEDEICNINGPAMPVLPSSQQVTKSINDNLENPDSDGYRCSYCDVVFEESDMLETHLATHLRKKEKKRCKCLLCGTICSSRSTMHKHLRRHNGDKPFSCRICGRAFNLKYSLKRHLMTHTGEKPFKCTVCDKAFARKDRRDVHTKVNHPNVYRPSTFKSLASSALNQESKSFETGSSK